MPRRRGRHRHGSGFPHGTSGERAVDEEATQPAPCRSQRRRWRPRLAAPAAEEEHARGAELPPPARRVSVRVLRLSGEVAAVVDLAATVVLRELKLRIYAVCAVPLEEQRLLCGTQVLDKDDEVFVPETLSDSGEVTVTLVHVPRWLAGCGLSDGSVRFIDIETGGVAKELSPAHARKVLALEVDWQRRRAVSSSSDMTVVEWDLVTDLPSQQLDQLQSAATALAVDWTDRRLLAGFADGCLALFALGGEGDALRCEGHGGRVTDIAPDWPGLRAVTASYDRTIFVWCLQSGLALQTLQGHLGVVMTVKACFPERLALSGGADGMLFLWRLPPPEAGEASVAPTSQVTAEPVASCRGHRGTVRALAADWPRALALSAGADATLQLWSCRRGGFVLLRKICGHVDEVTGLDVEWGSMRAVSGSRDGEIVVWDLDDGAALRRLPVATVAAQGRAAEILALAVDWRGAPVREEEPSPPVVGGQASGPAIVPPVMVAVRPPLPPPAIAAVLAAPRPPAGAPGRRRLGDILGLLVAAAEPPLD